MELKKISVLSLGKITGLFGVIYGLISGILISILVARSGSISGIPEQLGIFSSWGYMSLIYFPVIDGAAYFIAGILVAFIYNLLANKFGGIKIKLKESKKRKNK